MKGYLTKQTAVQVSRRSVLLGGATVAALPLLQGMYRPARAAGSSPAGSSIAWDRATLPAGYTERILGNPQAPVGIIEYSSLTCPHCATFHIETLPKVQKNFIDTGRAFLSVRDFPLDPLALAASMMLHRAPPSMFFTLLHVLFANQATWMRAEDPMKALRQYGVLSGLSGDAVEAALNDEGLMEAIQAVRSNASDVYDIDSTPSFIINNKKYAGALPYETFADLIAEAEKNTP